MADETKNVENPEPSAGVGAQLRAAREEAGLSVEQVAAETRISQRHVEHIEQGEFSELPGRTYAIGFAKNIAKVVGLDQRDVAQMVQAELDAQEPREGHSRQSFEPGDPARVPSARLVWFSLAAVLILLVGLFFAARTLFSPAAELSSLVEQQEQQQQQEQRELAAAAAARQEQTEAAPPTGPVVFTALEDGIWVRFYDASGSRLMEKQMAEGETYTVPSDVEGPQLWTGRPDALAISVGGRSIPRLAEDDMVMRDVPVSAEALLSREEPDSAPTAAPPA